MNNTMETPGYTGMARTLHWAVALLVIMQFIFIFWAEEVPKGEDLRGILFRLHFSTGFTVLLLAIWRLGYRLKNPPPKPEYGQPQVMQKVALTAHWAMYALIFVLPITGWMLVATAGGAIDWFWLFEIPNFIGENEGLHEQFEGIHETLGLTLLGIASVHLLAALWHHFVRKDSTLKRMISG